MESREYQKKTVKKILSNANIYRKHRKKKDTAKTHRERTTGKWHPGRQRRNEFWKCVNSSVEP